ncbi:MAG: ECF transporter S component [Christensenellales bacterium]
MAHTTREQHTRMLCTAGLMAALACVSNFISIATPASRIHIGNAFCVLCGLILGPAYGFFAAGVGNAIFDIIGGYGMEFIITFINKGAIALVTGLIAYKAASKETLERRITPASSSAACSAR